MDADRPDARAAVAAGGVLPALDPEKLMRLRVSACGEALARVTDAGEGLELTIATLNLRMLAARSAANEAARAADAAAAQLERVTTAAAEVQRLINLAGATLQTD
jgi:hypothetical protein